MSSRIECCVVSAAFTVCLFVERRRATGARHAGPVAPPLVVPLPLRALRANLALGLALVCRVPVESVLRAIRGGWAFTHSTCRGRRGGSRRRSCGSSCCLRVVERESAGGVQRTRRAGTASASLQATRRSGERRERGGVRTVRLPGGDALPVAGGRAAVAKLLPAKRETRVSLSHPAALHHPRPKSGLVGRARRGWGRGRFRRRSPRTTACSAWSCPARSHISRSSSAGV